MHTGQIQTCADLYTERKTSRNMALSVKVSSSQCTDILPLNQKVPPDSKVSCQTAGPGLDRPEHTEDIFTFPNMVCLLLSSSARPKVKKN